MIFNGNYKHNGTYTAYLKFKDFAYELPYSFFGSVYINMKSKMEVICPVHRVFWVTPDSLRYNHKCPRCATTAPFSKEEYRSKLDKIGKGIIAVENYITIKTKILHKHKTCGHEWYTQPRTILNGSGCPNCAIISGTKTFKDYRKEIEGTGYEVLEDYVNNHTKILHKHKTCGYRWLVVPTSILNGNGCPKCSKSGFDPTKPAILYYLSVKNGEAYKIGITNHSVKQRYSNEELQDIDVIEEWKFEDGQEAYDLEQIILKSYKHLKYTGEALLKSGNTEMFKEDILNKG